MKYPLPIADAGQGLLVPTYAELSQYTAGALPANPATGKTRLYADSNGQARLLDSTGAVRRIAAHWGSGTAFPTSAALAAGDTFVRTDVGTNGTLFQYTGVAAMGSAGWIAEGPVTCTAATRPTAALYAGVQLFETDTNITRTWSGTQWLAQAPLISHVAISPSGGQAIAPSGTGVFTATLNVTAGQRLLIRPKWKWNSSAATAQTIECTAGVVTAGSVAKATILDFDDESWRTPTASDVTNGSFTVETIADITVSGALALQWNIQVGTGANTIALTALWAHYTLGIAAP